MSAVNFPSSPTLGDTHSANGKSWRYNGTSWTTYNVASGLPVDYILLQDQKAAGTPGGTFTSGSWVTRTLNTEASDAGNWCSLSANQFTLAAGTYRIFASAPASAVTRHQTKLYNVTDAADTLIGTSMHAHAVSDYSTAPSMVVGRFTIASAKVFELRHKAQTTNATYGLGVEGNHGVIEIYAQVELWRESPVLLGSEYQANQIAQTASYILAIDDQYKTIHMNVGSANTLTVPPFADVAFPVGARIPIWQIGAGQTTLTPGSGVTLSSRGGALKIAGQYGSAMLEKQATNVWLATGDLTT